MTPSARQEGADGHGNADGGPRRPETDLALGRRRLRLVAVGFSLAFAVIAARLVDLVQWLPGDELTETVVTTANAAARPIFVEAAGAARYDITDRNGVLLATNLRVPSIFADPSLLPDKHAAAVALAAVLPGVDPRVLERRFTLSRRFAWVKHSITPKEQRAVLELGIPGVTFDADAEHRVYPKAELTSHIVGYVDVDDHGLAGVERYADQRLEAGSGAGPLALSLDTRIQGIVRDELRAAYQRFAPKGAAGIVLDRATGEILASVSLPDFDPNRPEAATDDQRLDRVTGGAYELGSLFKLFSTASALESGRVRPTDKFDATQPLQIGRFRIHDDHAQKRWLEVPECFMYSSNICTAEMTFAAGGAAPFDAFLQKLGFYRKPEIELPRAELGTPLHPRRWPDITVATTSFGHGIAISPLQFITGMGGLVADGALVPPTLFRRAPGTVPPGRQLVRPATVEALRWFMWLTVDKGTGSQAATPAYLVGGKTGTADKPAKGHRGYEEGAVIASFAGVFPLDRPRYVVLVMLDEPHGDGATHGLHYAAWTAAPVVSAIIDRAGPLLDVAPSDQRLAEAYRAHWQVALAGPGDRSAAGAGDQDAAPEASR